MIKHNMIDLDCKENKKGLAPSFIICNDIQLINLQNHR